MKNTLLVCHWTLYYDSNLTYIVENIVMFYKDTVPTRDGTVQPDLQVLSLFVVIVFSLVYLVVGFNTTEYNIPQKST